ncbi:Hsp20/alpha crystallin family protein [Plantibacter sp. Mn2098]|uniref:Hsp20/alpha crystallin family protein n=1 Tax=Plantibacter sp. Mn2098 TaxID=3395266 RepID=UPI003BC93A8A
MALTFDPTRDRERLAASLQGATAGPRKIPMDLYRDSDVYVLSADLPGVDPASVDIDVDGQLLTIRAERTPASGDDITWIARERRTGSYLRQFTLGQGIDTEHIAASYVNGVLNVTVPVSERAKPRKVQVATGASAAPSAPAASAAEAPAAA